MSGERVEQCILPEEMCTLAKFVIMRVDCTRVCYDEIEPVILEFDMRFTYYCIAVC